MNKYDEKLIEEILSEKKWEFKPCPFCGNTKIGVEDEVLDHLMGNNCPASTRRKIWAYCRYCGAESRKTVADIVYGRDEIAVAVEIWNRRI